MIVRTYQRRSRTGRSLSDNGFGGESSQSQDSPWSSSQDAFPLSQEAFPSSQESCWWQPESDTWTLPSSRSGGLPDESTLAGFTRSRPPVWSNRQVENGNAVVNATPFSSQNSQDLNGDVFTEKLVLDSDEADDRFPNQKSEWCGTGISANSWGPTTPATATLLEAQESGELMAHMDEANFALDGLRPGQPLRVQRASLQSLLSLCGSMQRRRLLRTHGLVKPLFDSVVALPLDDPPLALAAAAVLYFLALDGQNEDLFDSAACVRFLMGLLGSSLSRPAHKALSTVGNKLAGLGFRLKSGNVSSGVDKAGAAVVAEVHQLFAKDEKSPFGHLNKDETSGFLLGQEVSSKWLALLTVEKACISPVVLEDNSGSTRRMSGFFKERLRELGGLDTICDLAAGCLRNIREALEAEETEGGSKSRYFTALEKCEKNGGVGMLLRCLLVMENVTFLSEQNQRHLLELRLPRCSKDAPDTFVALIIATIKLLSELADCHKERKEILDKCNVELRGAKAIKKMDKLTETSASSSLKSFGAPSRRVFNEAIKKGPGIALLRLKSEAHTRQSINRGAENPLSKQKSTPQENLFSRSFLRISGTSSSGAHEAKPSSETLGLKRKESSPMDDSQDPFAFDDFEMDLESEKASKKRGRKLGKVEEASDTAKSSGRREPSDSQDPAALRKIAEDYREPSPHLAECLLSGVKVLMNLTNNNPVGCRQVANCGGLDAVSSLLVAYFPKPSVEALQVPGSSYEKLKGKDSDTDQDLEMVVVALGVLCNLVERDERNRSRLATLDVDLPPHIAAKRGSVSSKYGMIALLCALFLSKQGAGEAAEAIEEKMSSEVDEEVDISEGEREAEDMIVEAYTAVLLAFLSVESDVVRLAIAQLLPGDNLGSLVPVMERFLAFHLSLNMLSAETHAAITEVIDSCQQPMPLRELLL